jgi:predicted AAA+ superfamily ATPase
MKLKNPFLTAGYAGEEYFCDRRRETARMIAAFENDRNLTLIAPRRYGKTGLIKNALAKMPSEFTGIYLDIFSIEDLASFASAFASAVTGALDTPVEKTLSAVARFFKSCRPTITPQEDGTPRFSFDIAPSSAKATLDETFAYLKSKERRAVIAIDEFQQIAEFPEKGVEAALRSHIQFVPWIRFVFAGSRHHVMSEMFGSAKRPFYQSTEILSLGPIDPVEYEKFATGHFASRRCRVDSKVFRALYERFDGITWYVQAVLNKVWEFGGGFTSLSQIDEAVASLVEANTIVFHDLLRSQNEASRALLKAVAEEGCIASPTGGDFLSKHGFSSHSTVRSALKNLLDGDLLYQTDKGYIVYDRLFGMWLSRL